jgi:hypothetical protein
MIGILRKRFTFNSIGWRVAELGTDTVILMGTEGFGCGELERRTRGDGF